MDGSPPKDAQQLKPQEMGVNLVDKIRAEFDSLSPARRRNLVRSLFYSSYELPAGWTEYLDTHLVNPAKEHFGDNEPTDQETVPRESATIPETTTSLEDELATSVKDIGFFGKFPSGLKVGNRELAEPQSWVRDVVFLSPTTGWRKYPNREIKLLVGIFGNIYSGSSGKSEAGFIEEHTNPNDPNYSLITYCVPVINMRDASGRPEHQVFIMFNMPKEKASRLISEVKERPDGADFAERFLRKATPGVFAENEDGYGIRKGKITSLYVLDEQTQRNYFGDNLLAGYFDANFSPNREIENQSIARLEAIKSGQGPFVQKQYSSPAGITTP